MSTQEVTDAHLTQSQLQGNDQAILEVLSEWLSTARFEKQSNGWKLCTDTDLLKQWDLIKKMRLIQKVKITVLCL